jgi:hypothetical protein
MRRAIALVHLFIVLGAHGCSGEPETPEVDASPQNDAEFVPDGGTNDAGCTGSFACLCGDALCIDGQWTCGPCT